MEDVQNQWQKAWHDKTFSPDLPHPNVELKIREALAPYIPKNGTILDLGAGTGNMRYLPENFDPKLIHAVDISEEALSRNPAARKTAVDITKPFEDHETYDLVMSMFVLSSFPVEDQMKIIQNGLQKVNKNGWMVHIDFQHQTGMAVRMYPFDVAVLKQNILKNGVKEIVTQNIYPECFDDEDYTHYAPLDMLGIHNVISAVQPVPAPHQDL